MLKEADPYLKLVFITGVSKFSKVSLFSGLNNLKDITLHPAYATICGYTQEEFEKVFADSLEGVDLERVRLWYNGYSWLGEPVYNPFDILLFLDSKIYRPYWFETGTPTFLINLLLERNFYFPELEDLTAGDEILESFDVDLIEPEAILFQTGYLTIKGVEDDGVFRVYHLGYPNLEVRVAFNRHLLNYFFPSLSKKERSLRKLWEGLKKGEIREIEEVFRAFFASIPHDWYRRSEIQRYEGFYASVFYAYFSALGVEVRVEEATSQGQLDMVVKVGGRCYLFEFKVVEFEPEGRALEQLKAKRYHEKYAAECEEVYLIGVEFSQRERNIIAFEVEKV